MMTTPDPECVRELDPERVRELVAELRQWPCADIASRIADARLVGWEVPTGKDHRALRNGLPSLLAAAEAWLAAQARSGNYIHRSAFEGEEQRRADAEAKVLKQAAHIAELAAERDHWRKGFTELKGVAVAALEQPDD